MARIITNTEARDIDIKLADEDLPTAGSHGAFGTAPYLNLGDGVCAHFRDRVQAKAAAIALRDLLWPNSQEAVETCVARLRLHEHGAGLPHREDCEDCKALAAYDKLK